MAQELPMVAIVGRPNVGKSTLFNRIAGRRQALVHDLPGLTRDRVMAEVEIVAGRRATLVDTGGFDTTADDVIRKGIREQVDRAVRESEVILFVLDCRTGPSSQDLEVADRLRRSGRPVIVVGNKADMPHPDVQARMMADLHGLGFPEVFPVSAEHGLGFDDLLERVAELLPAPVDEGQKSGLPEPIKVAIVGRPNVGKSSLTNALLGDERCLVTEVAGTTRDAVDVLYESPRGERFLFIDTAGIRKKGKVDTAPEKLSVVMARKALERCDVALLVADASEDLGHQDAVVAGYAYEAGRAVAILLNKWDLLRGDVKRQEGILEQVRMKMKFLDFAPVLRVSARTGAGLARVLPTIKKAYAGATTKLPTGVLNRFSQDVVRRLSPATGLRSEVRIYYLTQTGTLPPTFTLFTNAKGRAIHFSYVRFLENKLRQAFGFEGSPIRLKVVARRPKSGKPAERVARMHRP